MAKASKSLNSNKGKKTYIKLASSALSEPNAPEIFQGHKSHITELFHMLTTCRPHRTNTEEAFITKYLDCLPGMQSDQFGNRYVQIGSSPLCWASHTDTVHWDEGTQSIHIEDDCVSLHKTSKASCLGADDTAGVWLMRQMILADVPGFYVFFRGEECGCLGSNFFLKNHSDKLAHIKAMISLDRKGYYEVITHQASGKTASDEFARSMAVQLFDGSIPSDLGVFTDSDVFAGTIGECSNLAVGYFHQHSKNEYVDYVFLDLLLHQLLALDQDKLTFAREPGDYGERWDSFYGSGYGSTTGKFAPGAFAPYDDQEPRGDLVQLIKKYPHEVADLLEQYGFSAKEVEEHVDELWNAYRKDFKEDDEDSADSDKKAYGG